YWTTEPLQPGEPYTVTATAADGRTSTASVTMPLSLPMPDIEYILNIETGHISGTGSGFLVVAEVRYVVRFIDDLGGIQGPYEHVFSRLGNQGPFNFPWATNYRFSFESRPLLTNSVGVPFGRIIIDS